MSEWTMTECRPEKLWKSKSFFHERFCDSNYGIMCMPDI